MLICLHDIVVIETTLMHTQFLSQSFPVTCQCFSARKNIFFKTLITTMLKLKQCFELLCTAIIYTFNSSTFSSICHFAMQTNCPLHCLILILHLPEPPLQDAHDSLWCPPHALRVTEPLIYIYMDHCMLY